MKRINNYILEKLKLNKEIKIIDSLELKKGDKVYMVSLHLQQSHLRLSCDFKCNEILSVKGNKVKYDIISKEAEVFLNSNNIYEYHTSIDNFKYSYTLLFKDLDKAIDFLNMCKNTPKNKFNYLELLKYFDKDDELIEKYKKNIRCYCTSDIFENYIKMLKKVKG